MLAWKPWRLPSHRIELVRFFQAEDGIRDAQESRGLGDVYKRQPYETQKSRQCLLHQYIDTIHYQGKQLPLGHLHSDLDTLIH